MQLDLHQLDTNTESEIDKLLEEFIKEIKIDNNNLLMSDESLTAKPTNAKQLNQKKRPIDNVPSTIQKKKHQTNDEKQNKDPFADITVESLKSLPSLTKPAE